MPLDGGASPKMKTKKLDIQDDINTDYESNTKSRLMVSSQMRGRGRETYGSRISSIDDFKRTSIEHEKLADFQYNSAFKESLESLKNI
jgi:hypothetical protein